MKRKPMVRAKLSEEAKRAVWEKLQRGETPKELAEALGPEQVMSAALEMCALEALPDFVKMVRDQRRRALEGEESAVKWLTEFLLKLKPESGQAGPRWAGLEDAMARLREYEREREASGS